MRSAGLTALAAALLLSGCQTSGPGSCGDTFTPIYEIQGADSTSALIGQVAVTEGVVTARFLDHENPGAFVQSASPDNNPGTSDALFAIGLNQPAGSRVRFSGTVTELDRRLTSIEVDAIQNCGSAPLPEPELVELPLRGRHIESLEATRIALTGALQFSDVTRIGSDAEAVVVTGNRLYSPTEVAQPGQIAEQVRIANLRRSMTVDDLSDAHDPGKVSWWPHASDAFPRVGQEVAGLMGIVDHRRGYRLRLTKSVSAPADVGRTLPPAPPARGNVRVVGFNVLNLFNGNGQGAGFPTSRGARSSEEYARQLAKVTATLATLKPDVVALAELENDGTGPLSAVADLTRALTDATGRTYQVSAVAPGMLGDDDIAVGLIFAADTLSAVQPAESMTTGPFADLNRPPLAQTLVHQSSGQTFTIVALHLKSKGCGQADGDNADQRDGQGCWNLERLEAARALDNWIKSHDTFDLQTTLLIGDFNAYSREDPVMYLAGEGYRSLVARRQPKYSYIYRGAAGSLDQALAGRTLSQQLAGAQYWHINADFPAWLDYRRDDRPASLYQPDPLRSSDHDPLVVDFQF